MVKSWLKQRQKKESVRLKIGFVPPLPCPQVNIMQGKCMKWASPKQLIRFQLKPGSKGKEGQLTGHSRQNTIEHLLNYINQ